MRFWPRTLGVQLIVVTAAAVLVSNLAVATWFELGSERVSETDLRDRLLDRAASAATLLAHIPASARVDAAKAMGSGVWRFDLRNGAEQPLPAMDESEERYAGRLRSMLPASLAANPISVKMMRMVPPHYPHRSFRSSDSAIRFVIPIEPGTQLIATFFRPPNPGWPTEVIIAAILAVVVASAAAAYISRKVARPLNALASSASVVATGGTAPHVPEDGPDDVRNAAKAFNAMTERVSRTLESQRQLLSAVGHDLRTPITAMRINLEFVQDQELRERLEHNLGELQALTESVLSAAKGSDGEKKRNIDLSALVESLCADLDDMGEPVAFNARKPAPMVCRPDEIRRAVRNLVENAVAYGNKAEVHIAESPRAYDIVVDDEGPGIAEADRQRVFEPFVRLETSRNSDTGGTGLGLTLVKAIAQGHGGTVTLENRSRGGLRARLTLPRSAERVASPDAIRTSLG